MTSPLQTAIQATIPRQLDAKELCEAESNLLGLFEVLLKINARERIIDTGPMPSYEKVKAKPRELAYAE